MIMFSKSRTTALMSGATASLIAASLLIAVFATTTTISQAYARTSDRAAQQESIDVSGEILDTGPCGNNELIELSGSAHVVSRVVQDESGVFHIVQHVNFQGVSGVGLTTGTTYRSPYAFNSISNFDIDSTGSATEITSFHLVSQGEQAQDYVVLAQFHVTVNANGELTSEIVNFRVECR
jgi:hypothetical protein